MLREEILCKLEAPTHDFALHVGFDLYMYVGSARHFRAGASALASPGSSWRTTGPLRKFPTTNGPREHLLGEAHER